MNLTGLFEKIAGKQKQRERARAGSFLELVRAIADGREPDADRVEAVLRDCGKSLTDLKKAVDGYLQRLEWARQIEQANALSANRSGIEQKIAAANKALDDAEGKHAEITNPLHFKLQQIQDAVRTAEQAKCRLWDTCLDEDLVAQLDQTNASLQAAIKQRSELTLRLADAQVGEQRAREELARTKDERRIQELQAQADRLVASAQELARTLADVSRQIRELESREATLRQKMLVP